MQEEQWLQCAGRIKPAGAIILAQPVRTGIAGIKTVDEIGQFAFALPLVRGPKFHTAPGADYDLVAQGGELEGTDVRAVRQRGDRLQFWQTINIENRGVRAKDPQPAAIR